MRIESHSKFLVILLLAVSSIAMTACDRSDPETELVTATEVDDGSTPMQHVVVSDGYTLRANTVQSETLPPEMLAQYGIEAGADRSILNLVILQAGPDGQDITVAADVTARQENLIGQSREIEMRAAIANNSTSYLGTFESSPRDFFRFRITAQPEGSDKRLLIEFEESFADLSNRADLNTNQ